MTQPSTPRPPVPDWLQLSRMLAEGNADPDQLTRYALDVACAVIPHARWASVTRCPIEKGKPRTIAANSARATTVDDCQYAAGEGPCLTAVSTDQPIVSDLATETRWPVFVSRVRAGALCTASLSVPLRGAGHPGDSLNVYSDTANAFRGDAMAFVPAATAALAMTLTAVNGQRERDGLQTALESNRRIGAAIGVLMGRNGLTYEQAFDLLRTQSQNHHRKLRDLAEEVLYTGTTGTTD